MDGPVPDPRRGLPALHRLLTMTEAAALLARHPRGPVVAALREGLATLRRGGQAFDADRFFAAVGAALDGTPRLRRVLNATGVVLHTHLGRAPLAPAALAAIAETGAGYASLELNLATGRRGDRHAACAALLRDLTGAEDALVVNNGA
ncbi:MAG TPA: L-seryl-tRNA(Sec) selenium transferase, partial [Acetobacteraceae bacterium]|nr:L-seryl-tRNA(Sec) selenium transferase [Acetobacteraceae bacterium]